MAHMPPSVPVSMGSPRFRTVEAGPFLVTEAWFPGDLFLEPHTHDRTCVAVILDGAFDIAFGSRRDACRPESILTEPAGEKHSNRFAAAGGRVVVVQPDPTAEVLRPCRSLLETVTLRSHAGIASLARRMAGEIRSPDTATPLALEAGALDMLASATRLRVVEERHRRPGWLARVYEAIHDRFLERLTVTALAAEAGVHPVHLGRVFRRHHAMSVGAYVRRLRLDWAADRLARSNDGLAAIALAAGFSDQPHFTRAFKADVGLTPDAYRRLKAR